MSRMSWFRVSVTPGRSFLAHATPLCQGLARYAGFDLVEAREVGAQIEDTLRKAIDRGRGAAQPSIDIVCQTDAGRFEARVTSGGQSIETIVRSLPQSV